MKQLVFATANPNKVAEVKSKLGDGYDFLSLADIGCSEEIPETTGTLEGNALQKAKYVKDNYGYDCFAEDSGLEIDMLALIQDGKEQLFEGRVDGYIAKQMTGDGGFGYDPIFIPEGHTKTFAQLPQEVKKEISHRSRAVEKLVGFLK